MVCFGDSITDGTNSTLNGDDRWPDVLARRLRAAGVDDGGGQCRHRRQPGGRARPSTRPTSRFRAARRALSRLDRDVLGLSGVTHVIWLEGINDFSTNGNATLEQVRDGMRAGVAAPARQAAAA